MRAALALALTLLAVRTAGAGAPSTDAQEFVHADLCIRCHLLAEGAGRRPAVVAWRRSVHFRKESACADCHGGDRLAALDCTKGFLALTDRAEAVDRCGRCHKPEATALRARRSDSAGAPRCTADCIDCHGHHEVVEADGHLLNETSCGKCHPFDRAKHTRDALQGVARRLITVEREIAADKDGGLPMEGAGADLAAVRKEIARAVHAVPPEGLARHLDEKIEGPVRRLEGRLARWTPAAWRAEGIGVVALLTVILVLIRSTHASLGGETPRGGQSGSSPPA